MHLVFRGVEGKTASNLHQMHVVIAIINIYYIQIMKKIVFLCLAAFMLMGCATTKQAASLSVNGEWKICQIQDLALAAAEDAPLPTLSFDEKSYHLYCGCNQIGGAYSLRGTTLTLEQGFSTKMLCPDVMDLEDALIALLNGAYTVAEESETLVLSDRDGATILRLIK